MPETVRQAMHRFLKSGKDADWVANQIGDACPGRKAEIMLVRESRLYARRLDAMVQSTEPLITSIALSMATDTGRDVEQCRWAIESWALAQEKLPSGEAVTPEELPAPMSAAGFARVPPKVTPALQNPNNIPGGTVSTAASGSGAAPSVVAPPGPVGGSSVSAASAPVVPLTPKAPNKSNLVAGISILVFLALVGFALKGLKGTPPQTGVDPGVNQGSTNGTVTTPPPPIPHTDPPSSDPVQTLTPSDVEAKAEAGIRDRYKGWVDAVNKHDVARTMEIFDSTASGYDRVKKEYQNLFEANFDAVIFTQLPEISNVEFVKNRDNEFSCRVVARYILRETTGEEKTRTDVMTQQWRTDGTDWLCYGQDIDTSSTERLGQLRGGIEELRFRLPKGWKFKSQEGKPTDSEYHRVYLNPANPQAKLIVCAFKYSGNIADDLRRQVDQNRIGDLKPPPVDPEKIGSVTATCWYYQSKFAKPGNALLCGAMYGTRGYYLALVSPENTFEKYRPYFLDICRYAEFTGSP